MKTWSIERAIVQGLLDAFKTAERITRPPRMGHDVDVVDGPEQLAEREAEEDVWEGATDWHGWALPAIYTALADHQASEEESAIDRIVYCYHPSADAFEEFPDWQAWREHVGDLIADRIACDPARAITALQNFEPK